MGLRTYSEATEKQRQDYEEYVKVVICRDGTQINYLCPHCLWSLNSLITEDDDQETKDWFMNSDNKPFKEIALKIHVKEKHPNFYEWLNAKTKKSNNEQQ